jgi:hypothetical protein
MNKTLEFFPTPRLPFKAPRFILKNTRKRTKHFERFSKWTEIRKAAPKNKKEKTDEMPPAPVQ